MDLPVQVPVDNPNADTEWWVLMFPNISIDAAHERHCRNGILRKHGIIPEKPPDPEPAIQEALIEAQQRAHDNRLENKTLDELHDLEDEEDDEFLEIYRRKRLAELSHLQKTSVYGQVFPIQKPDYARDVTDASSKSFVLVLLTSSLETNVESRVLSGLWRQLATMFGDVKFCEMRANLCIEGYPEKNTPTIIVYRDGNIQRQIVTLRELNGPRTNLHDLQNVLVEVGAVNVDDVRLRNDREDGDEEANVHQRRDQDADDDDWD